MACAGAKGHPPPLQRVASLPARCRHNHCYATLRPPRLPLADAVMLVCLGSIIILQVRTEWEQALKGNVGGIYGTNQKTKKKIAAAKAKESTEDADADADADAQ